MEERCFQKKGNVDDVMGRGEECVCGCVSDFALIG